MNRGKPAEKIRQIMLSVKSILDLTGITMDEIVQLEYDLERIRILASYMDQTTCNTAIKVMQRRVRIVKMAIAVVELEDALSPEDVDFDFSVFESLGVLPDRSGWLSGRYDVIPTVEP